MQLWRLSNTVSELWLVLNVFCNGVIYELDGITCVYIRVYMRACARVYVHVCVRL